MSRASALCVMPSCFRSALTTAVSILRRFMLVPLGPSLPVVRQVQSRG